MTSEEFLKIFDNYVDDRYDIQIVKAENHIETFELGILFKPAYWETEFVEELWSIKATGVQKAKVNFELSHYLEIKDNHPLLWEYTDKTVELYISSRPEYPQSVFSDLYHCHDTWFSGFISFESFFNSQCPPLNILQQGRGLLADGPKTFLEKLADILASHQIKYSLYEHQKTKEVGALKVFFINESYIIAEDFDFQKVS